MDALFAASYAFLAVFPLAVMALPRLRQAQIRRPVLSMAVHQAARVQQIALIVIGGAILIATPYVPACFIFPVSYTHLTLPTNREV